MILIYCSLFWLLSRLVEYSLHLHRSTESFWLLSSWAFTLNLTKVCACLHEYGWMGGQGWCAGGRHAWWNCMRARTWVSMQGGGWCAHCRRWRVCGCVWMVRLDNERWWAWLTILLLLSGPSSTSSVTPDPSSKLRFHRNGRLKQGNGQSQLALPRVWKVVTTRCKRQNKCKWYSVFIVTSGALEEAAGQYDLSVKNWLR